jgi:hypothetical protein
VSRFDLKTFGSDTMLNYQLSQKLKLIGRCKFNHLIISLTATNKSKTLIEIIFFTRANVSSKSIP